jgi:hypothetical protein
MTFPVHAYGHSTENGCCIVGGYRYRGTLFPNMLARYFFADYCSDNIWSLYDSAGAWGTVFHGKFGGNSFSTFGEDNKGELYIAGLVSGTIYHIIDSSAQSVEQIGSTSFTVFPNPVSGWLQIRNNGKVDATMQIRIASLQGITVYSGISAGSETAIDMGSLAPGLYILEIRTNEGTGIVKLVRK